MMMSSTEGQGRCENLQGRESVIEHARVHQDHVQKLLPPSATSRSWSPDLAQSSVRKVHFAAAHPTCPAAHTVRSVWSGGSESVSDDVYRGVTAAERGGNGLAGGGGGGGGGG